MDLHKPKINIHVPLMEIHIDQSNDTNILAPTVKKTRMVLRRFLMF